MGRSVVKNWSTGGELASNIPWSVSHATVLRLHPRSRPRRKNVPSKFDREPTSLYNPRRASEMQEGHTTTTVENHDVKMQIVLRTSLIRCFVSTPSLFTSYVSMLVHVLVRTPMLIITPGSLIFSLSG